MNCDNVKSFVTIYCKYRYYDIYHKHKLVILNHSSIFKIVVYHNYAQNCFQKGEGGGETTVLM